MRLIVIVGFLLMSISGFSQNERYAQTSGDWTSVTWTNDKAGTIPAAAPTLNDDVFTNGQAINITGTSVTVRNLAVSASVAGSLNWTGAGTVTVRGALVAWDDANDTPTPPSAAILTGASRITLTAADLSNTFLFFLFNNEILGYWNDIAPITNLTINLVNDATLDADLTSEIRVTNQLQITGSGRTLTTGFNISGIQVVNAFVLGSGVIFDTTVPIKSSSLPTSRVNAASISGTLITSNFFNCTNFNLTATGLFRTTFSGADQTQGWWYQSTNPTGGTTNAASTIYFEADANQNIPARTYGNLFLDASSNVTKTLSSGTLNIAGGLTINSSSVTFNSNAATSINIGANLIAEGDWSPADPVVFNGAVAQSIQGNGSVTFSGGLQLNKSSGTLTLNKNIIVANGITITTGTLDLGSQTVTLNSGNITNNGTFTPTSSTLTINGATTINGVNPVSFHHLTIAASGNLSSSGNVNVSGNLSNSGTVNAGTIIMNGTSLQTITGTLAIENITSSNAVGVNNNGTINLSGTLSLSGSGRFDADGTGSGILRLISSDLSTGGRIATLTTPTNFTGNITVQRFVEGPDRYRYFSVPITNATVSMWQDDFPVTGNFSNPSPNGVNGVEVSTAPSIFRFDGPSQQYVAVGTGASTGATALSSTVGYTAYTYLTGDFTISIAGNPVKSSISIPVSSVGDGWNLIPNPYPSPIDWDNVTTTGTTNTVYMTFAEGAGGFSTYLKGNNFCTNCDFNTNWRGEIALGQSFWIESTGAANIGLTETAKTSSATFLREGEEGENFLRIALLSQGKKDDMIIHFNANASTGTEFEFDAKKRLNDSNLNLSSYNVTPSDHYAINGIPLVTCDAGTVKLKMSNLTVGEHSLSFTELDKLKLGYTTTLIDNFLSTENIIENNELITFQTTADPASTADGRFELRFTSPSIQAVASSSLSIESTCESNLLNVGILNSQLGVTYQLFKGELPVSDVMQGNGGELSTIVLKSILSTGLNSLNLKANTLDGCQTTSFDNIISYEVVNVPQVLSVIGATICNTGNATITAMGSSEAVAYRWYDSQLNDASYVQTVGNSLTLDNVTESRSYYVSVLNKNGCESLTRMLVDISVTEINTPQISLNGTLLSSSASTGNQWYKNGEVIPGATSASYEVTETGIYTVSVTLNTCTVLSDEITVAITGLELNNNQIISAYPNPVNDWLTIEIPAEVAATVNSLNLVDARGSVISAYNPSEISKGSLLINMTEQSKGLYYLNVRTAKRTLVYRIIKN